MKKTASNFILLLIAVTIFGLTGCVTKADMQTLQLERQQDLQRIKQLEAELAESKQMLEEEIENSNSPIRERSADMWAEIQSLRSEFAKLRGQVDSLNIRMDRQVGENDSPITIGLLDKRMKEVEFALENQLQVDLPKVREEHAATLAQAAEAQATEAQTATEGAGSETASTTGETVVAPAPVPAQPETPPQDTDPAKALYDKAYALYKEGQYEKARSYWAEFTDTFKGHRFTPSAVFWQGQCYFKLKDYARSVILFEDVIDKFKKSSKYKSALLKAGYCWNYLGKPELAKMRFDEVVKKFPKSVEATQAKRTLDKMK